MKRFIVSIGITTLLCTILYIILLGFHVFLEWDLSVLEKWVDIFITEPIIQRSVLGIYLLQFIFVYGIYEE